MEEINSINVFCPLCGFKFNHKKSYKGKLAGGTGGAGAGAIIGAKIGIAMGPLGAIAGTIPGAVLGGIFGKNFGKKYDNPQCPKCSAKFEISTETKVLNRQTEIGERVPKEARTAKTKDTQLSVKDLAKKPFEELPKRYQDLIKSYKVKQHKMGKNWNSKKREYTDIVKRDTRAKANKAKEMKMKGKTVSEIAAQLNLSKSRIYEYLRE